MATIQRSLSTLIHVAYNPKFIYLVEINDSDGTVFCRAPTFSVAEVHAFQILFARVEWGGEFTKLLEGQSEKEILLGSLLQFAQDPG